jgi:nitrate/nitrite-specific signal transduction histidine kinase
MLREELIKKEAEYEELNKSLEKRVQEQTRELKELNQTLEKRVREAASMHISFIKPISNNSLYKANLKKMA